MSLNPKQHQFAIEYLVDLNMTAAYKRAGYKASGHAAETNAARLLKNAEVQAIVQAGRKEVEKKTLVSVEFVIGGLKEVAERCLQRVPVMRFDREKKCMVQETAMVEGSDGECTEQGIWEFDSGGANRSLELLGKHVGAFTDSDVEDLPMPISVSVNVYDGRKPA